MSLNIFVSQQHVQTLQIRAKNRNVCGGIASTSECERMRSRDIGDILKDSYRWVSNIYHLNGVLNHLKPICSWLITEMEDWPKSYG